MKKYKLRFDKRYLKDLEKIPRQFRNGIREKVNDLAENPRPEGSIKLSGSKNNPLYRIRYGDYRIVYTIQDHLLVIIIIELGHRKDIYRDL